MSFLAPSLEDNAQEITNTPYEVSGVVPVVYGRARLQMKLLADRWNFTENDDGSSRPKGYWQSLAGVICNGPIDAIDWGYNNDDYLWEVAVDFKDHSALTDAYAYYYNQGTVNEFCAIDKPWGDFGFRIDIYPGYQRTLPARLLDGVGVSTKMKAEGGSFVMNAEANIHPPYAGYCFVVVRAMTAGFPDSIANSDTLPNLEFVVRRNLSDWPKHWNENQYINYGENPIGVVWDLITNKRYGLGLPESRFPIAAWQVVAQSFVDNGWYKWDGTDSYKASISPYLQNKTAAREFITDLLGYIDAFIYQKDGYYYIGYEPRKGATYTGLPVLRKKYATSVAEIERKHFSEASDVAEVTYNTTEDNEFETDTITKRNPQLYAITGERRIMSISNPFVLRTDAAKVRGQLALDKEAALPATITLSFLDPETRYDDGTPIIPGDLVQLDYDDLSSNAVYRVTKRDYLDDGDVALTMAEVADIRAPGWDDTVDDVAEQDEPDPVAIDTFLAFEAPDGFYADGSKCILFAERSDYTQHAEVYFSNDCDFDGEESQLDDMYHFADFGEVVSMTEVSGVDQLTFTTGGGTYESDYLSESYSSSDQLNGAMLLVNGTTGEIYSLGSLIASDSGQRTYAVSRAYGGSEELPATAGDEIIIMPRDYWYSVDRVEYADPDTNPTTYYRLAPVTQYSSGVAGDTFELTLRTSLTLLDVDSVPLLDADGATLQDIS